MAADLGAACFEEQPLTAQHFFIGQTLMAVGFPFSKNPRGNGAQILGMADTSTIIQLPYYVLDQAVNPVYYEWEFEYQADFEDEYILLERARALGKPKYLVDHITEYEAFISRDGQTDFTLKRDRATDVITSFDSVTFPDRVFLDDVEQTIVGSSPPGAGEVYLSGRTVEFPALTFDQEIVVQYYPAYTAVFTNPNYDLSEYNDLRRNITATETQHQSV